MWKLVGEAILSSFIQIVIEKLYDVVRNSVVGKKLEDNLIQKLARCLRNAGRRRAKTVHRSKSQPMAQ
jgi:hypothetical protein